MLPTAIARLARAPELGPRHVVSRGRPAVAEDAREAQAEAVVARGDAGTLGEASDLFGRGEETELAFMTCRREVSKSGEREGRREGQLFRTGRGSGTVSLGGMGEGECSVTLRCRHWMQVFLDCRLLAGKLEVISSMACDARDSSVLER